MGAWRKGARKILTPLPLPGAWGTSSTALFSPEQEVELGTGPGDEEESPSGARLPYPGTRGQATGKVCEETEREPLGSRRLGPGCLDSRAQPLPALLQPSRVPCPWSPSRPTALTAGRACVRPAWAAPWDMAGEPHSWVISPPPSGILSHPMISHSFCEMGLKSPIDKDLGS